MSKIANLHRRQKAVFLVQRKEEKTMLQGRLTVKQEKFCLEYAKTGNQKKNAYSAAGVESHRLLKNPKIKARLKEIHERHNAEKIMQIEEMKMRLTNIARGDNIKEALKAMELLAKTSGLFVSKQEFEINTAVPIVIKDNV